MAPPLLMLHAGIFAEGEDDHTAALCSPGHLRASGPCGAGCIFTVETLCWIHSDGKIQVSHKHEIRVLTKTRKASFLGFNTRIYFAFLVRGMLLFVFVQNSKSGRRFALIYHKQTGHKKLEFQVLSETRKPS